MLLLFNLVINTASKRSRCLTKSQKHAFLAKPPSTEMKISFFNLHTNETTVRGREWTAYRAYWSHLCRREQSLPVRPERHIMWDEKSECFQQHRSTPISYLSHQQIPSSINILQRSVRKEWLISNYRMRLHKFNLPVKAFNFSFPESNTSTGFMRILQSFVKFLSGNDDQWPNWAQWISIEIVFGYARNTRWTSFCRNSSQKSNTENVPSWKLWICIMQLTAWCWERVQTCKIHEPLPVKVYPAWIMWRCRVKLLSKLRIHWMNVFVCGWINTSVTKFSLAYWISLSPAINLNIIFNGFF